MVVRVSYTIQTKYDDLLRMSSIVAKSFPTASHLGPDSIRCCIVHSLHFGSSHAGQTCSSRRTLHVEHFAMNLDAIAMDIVVVGKNAVYLVEFTQNKPVRVKQTSVLPFSIITVRLLMGSPMSDIYSQWSRSIQWRCCRSIFVYNAGSYDSSLNVQFRGVTPTLYLPVRRFLRVSQHS